MRRFLFAALLLAAPTLAHAKDWYVSPSGSGTAFTSGSPGALSAANDSVKAGDRVILLASGTAYSTAIAPGRSGNSITSRITYMSANLTASSVTVTPGLDLTKSYVTIKGITFTGEVAFPAAAAAVYDSIHACTLNGGCTLMDSDHCMISNNTIYGEKFRVRASGGDPDDETQWCDSDSVYNNTITTVTSANANIMMEFRQTRHLMFINNHCTMVSYGRPAIPEPIGLGGGGSSGVKWFYVQDSKFVDNYWSVTTNCAANGDSTCDEAGYCVIRDRTYRNLYLRDTLLVGSNGDGVSVRLSHGGNTGNNHTEYDNNFESCFIKNSAGVIEYIDGIEADTLRNNVFVGTGNALRIVGSFNDNLSAPALIDHNTLVTLGNEVFFGTFALGRATFLNEVVAKNNIMYSLDTTMVDPVAQHVGEFGAGVYDPGDFNDEITTLDHNLYWNGANPPIAEYYTGGAYRRRTVAQWYGDTGFDQHSLGASPLFADSSLATFDARMLAGSASIGGSWPDGYVGAQRYPPPGTITDLGLYPGKNSIMVTWTASGADGSSGTATSYDLRRSTSPINDGNFASATQVTTPTPSESGTAECATATGLSSCTTYYFAIKATDDLSIKSAISNLPSVTTSCSGNVQVACGLGRAIAGGGEDGDQTVSVFDLTIASSNPVGERATLRCAIPPQGARVPLELGVFDLAGRRIQTLNRGVTEAGVHMISWDLRDHSGNRVRPGLYFVRGRNAGTQITRTLVVQ